MRRKRGSYKPLKEDLSEAEKETRSPSPKRARGEKTNNDYQLFEQELMDIFETHHDIFTEMKKRNQTASIGVEIFSLLNSQYNNLRESSDLKDIKLPKEFSLENISETSLKALEKLYSEWKKQSGRLKQKEKSVRRIRKIKNGTKYIDRLMQDNFFDSYNKLIIAKNTRSAMHTTFNEILDLVGGRTDDSMEDVSSIERNENLSEHEETEEDTEEMLPRDNTYELGESVESVSEDKDARAANDSQYTQVVSKLWAFEHEINDAFPTTKLKPHLQFLDEYLENDEIDQLFNNWNKNNIKPTAESIGDEITDNPAIKKVIVDTYHLLRKSPDAANELYQGKLDFKAYEPKKINRSHSSPSTRSTQHKSIFKRLSHTFFKPKEKANKSVYEVVRDLMKLNAELKNITSAKQPKSGYNV